MNEAVANKPSTAGFLLRTYHPRIDDILSGHMRIFPDQEKYKMIQFVKVGDDDSPLKSSSNGDGNGNDDDESGRSSVFDKGYAFFLLAGCIFLPSFILDPKYPIYFYIPCIIVAAIGVILILTSAYRERKLQARIGRDLREAARSGSADLFRRALNQAQRQGGGSKLKTPCWRDAADQIAKGWPQARDSLETKYRYAHRTGDTSEDPIAGQYTLLTTCDEGHQHKEFTLKGSINGSPVVFTARWEPTLEAYSVSAADSAKGTEIPPTGQVQESEIDAAHGLLTLKDFPNDLYLEAALGAE